MEIIKNHIKTSSQVIWFRWMNQIWTVLMRFHSWKKSIFEFISSISWPEQRGIYVTPRFLISFISLLSAMHGCHEINNGSANGSWKIWTKCMCVHMATPLCQSHNIWVSISWPKNQISSTCLDVQLILFLLTYIK